MRLLPNVSMCAVLVVGALCLCGCPRSAQYEYNGHGYDLVYVSSGITWTEAQAAAASRSVGLPRKQGYLASITSSAENDWVVNQFLASGDVGHVLVGGYQTADSGCPGCSWNWDSGEVWSYDHFMGNEPDDTDYSENDEENYLGIGGVTGVWEDTGNQLWEESSLHYYYLVEYD
ncbi:MAG: hypothetical protein GY851_18350 [bacterium]|nr:hypothetical protein [bacterium]